MLERIKKAKRILIIYLETPNSKIHTCDEDIICGYEKLHKKYPNKTIDILYFIHNPNVQPHVIEKYKLSNNVTKIVGNYKSQINNCVDYAVDENFVGKLLASHYQLNLTLIQHIKYYALKYAIELIPVKSVRKKLKRHCQIR